MFAGTEARYLLLPNAVDLTFYWSFHIRPPILYDYIMYVIIIA